MKAFGRFLRRFHRLLIPVAAAVLTIAGIIIVHALDQPDVTDGNYLSPASSAGIGAADLAGELRAAGVAIRNTADIDTAFTWARAGDTTLFIPAPSLLNQFTPEAWTTLPATTRLVVVDPSAATLGNTDLPVDKVDDRWVTYPAAAGCTAPEATGAGRAATDRHRYVAADLAASCYHGSVVWFAGADIWLVGSAEPFRNDHIGDYGNRALTVNLLSAHDSVVWLDNHRQQAEPPVGSAVTNPFNPPDAPPPDGQHTVRSIAFLLPGWAWTVLGMLMLMLLLLAAAAARRFGPPVAEPLPVTAKARETVSGRGRLYRRARQPAAALATLRADAVKRLPALLGLPDGTPADAVCDAAAARSGLSRDTVDAILHTEQPSGNEDLVAAVARLDDLLGRLATAATPVTDSPTALVSGMDRS